MANVHEICFKLLSSVQLTYDMKIMIYFANSINMIVLFCTLYYFVLYMVCIVMRGNEKSCHNIHIHGTGKIFTLLLTYEIY